MKHALLIAYHYPPARGSSGLQRTLKLSKYLSDFGWSCDVLTVATRAHPLTSPDLLDEIPADVPVTRAFALDCSRHLAIAGRYPSWLAYPDRWGSWMLGALPAARSIIKRRGTSLIWSTFPIATAHWIGAALAERTGLPWVADFRDSMTEDNYPPDPRTRATYRKIEARALRAAARSVFTTPGARRMYLERYPDVPGSRFEVIENGFDEEDFARITPAAERLGRRIQLLHSGLLYPSERDPRAFLGALADLKRAGTLDATKVEVVLRGSGHDREIAPMIAEHGVGDLVTLAPPLGYAEALAEMMAADILLLFQAANCNHQIPAKLYEYLRSRRPVLGLTDAAGDTAATLRNAGVDTIVALDDRTAIAAKLAECLQRRARGALAGVAPEVAARYTRRAQVKSMALMFERVLSEL
jgi:glycosyltransferase involved in cell wall biosynthesis